MNKTTRQFAKKMLRQKHYYQLVVMAILISLLEFILAYYLNSFVSAINRQSLTRFIWLGCGLIIVGISIGVIQKYLKIKEGMLQVAFENSLTNQVFQSSLIQPSEAVFAKPLGAWLSLNNSDAPIVSQTLAVSLTEMISGLASFLAALVFGLIISPWLTVTIMMLGLFSLLIPKFTSKWILSTQQRRQFDQDAMQTTLLQIFNAKILLFTFQAKQFAQKLFKTKYQTYTNSQLASAKSQHMIESISMGTGFLFDVTTLIISLGFVAMKQITIGQFMGFNVLNSSFTWIFYSMPGIYNQLLKGAVSEKRLLAFGIGNVQKHNEKQRLSLASGLVLNHVSFKYPQSKNWVLRDVNLTFDFINHPKILLTGDSGSGKSTFLKILLGFNQPNSGKLGYLLDDGEIGLPGNVALSYVPQQVRLFSMSLKENILLGRDISTEKYQRILAQTDLQDFVQSLSQRDATLINSVNQGNLSSGQIQKIGVARALVQGANFMLFDEPTANLDAKSAEDFEKLLISLPTSALIISHRAMKNVDRLIHYKLMNRNIKLDMGGK